MKVFSITKMGKVLFFILNFPIGKPPIGNTNLFCVCSHEYRLICVNLVLLSFHTNHTYILSCLNCDSSKIALRFQIALLKIQTPLLVRKKSQKQATKQTKPTKTISLDDLEWLNWIVLDSGMTSPLSALLCISVSAD